MHLSSSGGARVINNATTSNLKLCYTNTDNSLLSKIDELRIRAQQEKYDIIALNEIKPKHGEMPDTRVLSLDGYTMYISDTEAADTRGVCIYVSNKFKSNEVILEEVKYKDMLCVSICGSNTRKLLISCIYRSGSPDKAKEHDEDLFSAIRKFSDQPSHNLKVMCGDFNLNRIKWTPSPEISLDSWTTESSFIDCVRDTFMFQHVTEPTRFRSGQRPTCDDLVFSTLENEIKNLSYQLALEPATMSL